ncbi:MAG: hypothetical protein M1150_04140 [Patescibacteria group bacterium]|nr:hypothetical protein [Patescibacteria group bacterium]
MKVKTLKLKTIFLSLFFFLIGFILFSVHTTPIFAAQTIFSDDFNGSNWNIYGSPGCFGGGSPYAQVPPNWTGWNLSQDRCVQKEPFTVKSGSSVKFTNTFKGQPPNAALAGIYQSVGATPNRTYTLSGDSFRGFDRSADFVGFQFCSDSSCNPIDWKVLYGIPNHNPNSWFKFSQSATAPSDAKNLNVFLAGGINGFAANTQSSTNNQSNDTYFDDVSLTVDDFPTSEESTVLLGRVARVNTSGNIDYYYGAECNPTDGGLPNYTVTWTQNSTDHVLRGDDCGLGGPRYSSEHTLNPLGSKTGTSVTVKIDMDADVNGNEILLTDWQFETTEGNGNPYPNSKQSGKLNPGGHQVITINIFRDGEFKWNHLWFFSRIGNLATCESVSAPDHVIAGDPFTAVIGMKNVGLSTWTIKSKYYLGSQYPTDNTIWGNNRVNLPYDYISTDKAAEFSFESTAPSRLGKYNFYWKMFQEGVEWFGQTCGKVIDVVSPPPTASISGPTTAYTYQALTFTGTANSSTSNLTRGDIYIIKTNGKEAPKCQGKKYEDKIKNLTWCTLIQQPISGSSGTFSGNYTPTEAGDYYVVVNALSSDAQCTGNPFYLPPGWADCGRKGSIDYLTLKVTAMGTVTGYVWKDSDGSKIKDGSETNMASVTVCLGDTSNCQTTTTSGYSFLNSVSPNEGHTVSITIPNHWLSTTPPSISVSVTPGGTAYVNFGLNDKQLGWFQTGGTGDVYAAGNVTVSQIGYEASPAKFMLSPEGVLSSSGSATINPSTAAPGKRVQNYPLASPNISYNYYRNLATQTNVTINPIINNNIYSLSSQNNPTQLFYEFKSGFNIECPGGAAASLGTVILAAQPKPMGPPGSSSNCSAGKWTIPANNQLTIFALGNLTIKSNIVIPIGSSLTVISSGNITIDPEVGNSSMDETDSSFNDPSLEGVYIADGGITVAAQGPGSTEKRFIGKGAFLALGSEGLTLNRDLDRGSNRFNMDFPAEKFIYRPDLLVNAPSLLKKASYTWQETSP